MKRQILKLALFVTLSIIGCVTILPSCEYHNDDDQTEHENNPDPEPEPEPEPDPEKYTEALKLPNCYLVKPGESVSIPVLKAYAVWDIYTEELVSQDISLSEFTPVPELLWQDEPGLITAVGLLENMGEDSQFVVSTAGKTGNAVVVVRFGGIVRWSWHIWVTEYDPDLRLFGKTYDWDNNSDKTIDYVWMDRNLGAQSDGTLLTPADSLAACGLLYQWGRKDPFPGDRALRHTTSNNPPNYDSRPIYDMQGNQLPETGLEAGEGIYVVRRSKEDPLCGLGAAICNPRILYLGVSGYSDWYASEAVDSNDELWGMSGDKSPFDPCPEGWRVPAYKNEKSPWNGLENATTPYSPLGVFPQAGFRYIHNGGALKNSGFGVSIWSGSVISGGNGMYLSIYNDYAGRPQIQTTVSERSTGASIRCVKE